MTKTDNYSWWRPSRIRLLWLVQWYFLHLCILIGAFIGVSLKLGMLAPGTIEAIKFAHMAYALTAAIIWLINPPETFFQSLYNKFKIG